MRFTKIDNEWAFYDTMLNMRAAWYTESCLEDLIKRDWNNKTIYEYGAGYSTLWWRALGAKVSGVDYNNDFIHTGIKLQTVPDLYPYDIQGYYDCIVIDGIVRDWCFIEAKKHLNKDGIIVIDNYAQEEFPTYDVKEFNSMIFKQPGHKDWATAILWK